MELTRKQQVCPRGGSYVPGMGPFVPDTVPPIMSVTWPCRSANANVIFQPKFRVEVFVVNFWAVNRLRVNFEGALFIGGKKRAQTSTRKSAPKFGAQKFASQNSTPNSGSGGAKSPLWELAPDRMLMFIGFSCPSKILNWYKVGLNMPEALIKSIPGYVPEWRSSTTKGPSILFESMFCALPCDDYMTVVKEQTSRNTTKPL